MKGINPYSSDPNWEWNLLKISRYGEVSLFDSAKKGMGWGQDTDGGKLRLAAEGHNQGLLAKTNKEMRELQAELKEAQEALEFSGEMLKAASADKVRLQAELDEKSSPARPSLRFNPGVCVVRLPENPDDSVDVTDAWGDNLHAWARGDFVNVTSNTTRLYKKDLEALIPWLAYKASKM